MRQCRHERPDDRPIAGPFRFQAADPAFAERSRSWRSWTASSSSTASWPEWRVPWLSCRRVQARATTPPDAFRGALGLEARCRIAGRRTWPTTRHPRRPSLYTDPYTAGWSAHSAAGASVRPRTRWRHTHRRESIRELVVGILGGHARPTSSAAPITRACRWGILPAEGRISGGFSEQSKAEGRDPDGVTVDAPTLAGANLACGLLSDTAEARSYCHAVYQRAVLRPVCRL